MYADSFYPVTLSKIKNLAGYTSRQEERVNNTSIKQIVLGGFLMVNLVIVLLVGLSYKSVSDAKEGFINIAQNDDIAQEFANTQENLLKGMTYINLYFAQKSTDDLDKYKENYNIAEKSIQKVVKLAEINHYIKDKLVQFKDIKTKLQNLNGYILAKSVNLKQIKSLEEGILKDIGKLQAYS